MIFNDLTGEDGACAPVLSVFAQHGLGDIDARRKSTVNDRLDVKNRSRNVLLGQVAPEVEAQLSCVRR
jgi:hypothetical protein